jgi:hypothetical protein
MQSFLSSISHLNTWHSAEVVQAWTPGTVQRCSSDVTICPGPKTGSGVHQAWTPRSQSVTITSYYDKKVIFHRTSFFVSLLTKWTTRRVVWKTVNNNIVEVVKSINKTQWINQNIWNIEISDKYANNFVRST